jgi:KUP system potassium uptake protein
MGHPQEQKSLQQNMIIAIAALGVVFGDIGTSVLYTFQECFHGHHPLPVNPDNVMGITSLILWALVLSVTVKYVWVLLNAENKGEGGILTLLSLVPLPFRINTGGTLAFVSLLAVGGAALLYGDGIITPAISVLSAMEGITLINSEYEKYVMPGTMIIIAALFSIQSRGASKIGNYFGIIVLGWFVTIGFLGLRFILQNPEVLKAFNPVYATHFFQHEGFSGIKVLGSVILAVTGGEALYADMGHFGKKPIRLAWHWIVLPALMLNYLGQAALIINNPEASTRPFYLMVDQGPLYIGLVILATAATIIASQALITGVSSLTYQAIRIGVFPRLTVVHTSAELEGRVYIPFINWALAFACIITVLIFQKSTNLAAAYGLAVAGTMTLTTFIFFYVCHFRWKWALWKSLPLVGALLTVDCAFLFANLEKIPDGGYFPLIIGMFFFFSMVSWQYGRAQLSRFYKEKSKSMDQFFEEICSRSTRRIKGTLVVLASNENKVPPVLARLVDTMHVIHEHVILVTVMTEDQPFTNDAQKIKISHLKENVSRVVLRFGFMETPDIPMLLAKCHFSHLDRFPSQEAIYLLGRETFVIDGKNLIERIRQVVFSTMSRNSASASDYFNLPANQVLELGAQLSV